MATNKYKYLKFFNKKGHPLNFEYNSDTDTWSGELYFERVSTGLYENEQIFILEEVRTGLIIGNELVIDGIRRFTYPILWNSLNVSPPPAIGAAEWQAEWTDDKDKKQIALYAIENQRVTNRQNKPEDLPFIVKFDRLSVPVDQSLQTQQYILQEDWTSTLPNFMSGPAVPPGMKILVKSGGCLPTGDFLSVDYNDDWLIGTDCEETSPPAEVVEVTWTRQLDGRALQFNVLLSSDDENIYQRRLQLKDASFTSDTFGFTMNPSAVVFANIDFYGETIEEDERLRLVLENFGRTFDQSDAFIAREFDIKEELPDWQVINDKRKQLMLAGNEIFPYMGSYRGFIAAMRFFGYQDLRVKEYWMNIDTKSENYGKYLQHQINGLLLDEQVTSIKHPLVNTKTYRKTAKFGLFYDITVETGEFDQWAVPITEEAFQFTPEEVLVKLFALKERLKRDFLPLDARIVDIVGEGIYFERIGINTWSDNLKVIPLDVNEQVDFTATPSVGYVRDLRRFNVQRFPDGLTLPVDRFTNTVNPYSLGQNYPVSALPSLVSAIDEFYTELNTFQFPYNGEKSLYSYDEPGVVAGCPIVLRGILSLITWEDMSNTTWDNIANLTWGNIDFRHFYEMEWIIEKSAPQPYFFRVRGSIADYQTLPHFLPFVGEYKITMRLYDLYNSYSVKSTENAVEVLPRELEVAVLTRFRSTDDYTLGGGASELTWGDLASSELGFPIEGVTPDSNPIVSALSNWARYRNQDDFLVLDPDGVRREYMASTHPNRDLLGTRFLGWSALEDLTWEDMYHSTLGMMEYHGDFLGGFRMYDPTPGDTVSINDWPGHTFGPIVTLQDAADELNASDDPGISLFQHVVRFQPLAGNWQIGDFVAGIGSAVFVNDGGDNWTLSVDEPSQHWSATGATLVDYDVEVDLWQAGSSTNMVSSSGNGASVFSIAGLGAGVYSVFVTYNFSNGLNFKIGSYTLVDGAGNILAAVGSQGSTINSVFHMTVDEFGTLDQTGVSYPYDWEQSDGASTAPAGVPNQLGVHVLAMTGGVTSPITSPPSATSVVGLSVEFDSLFLTDYPGAAIVYTHEIGIVEGVQFIHSQARTPGSDGWRFVNYSGTVNGDAHSFRMPTWLNYQYDDPYFNYVAEHPSLDPAITFLDMLSLDDTSAGATDNLAYWENEGYIKTEPPSALYPLGERRGHLPSWAGSGSFSNEVRVYSSDFSAPLGATMFFVCNHAENPGKTDFLWRVINEETGETVIDVKGKNFLIYTFTEPSQYSVYLSLNDSNGNFSEVYKKGFVRIEKRATP